jgi:hypothetical protein
MLPYAASFTPALLLKAHASVIRCLLTEDRCPGAADPDFAVRLAENDAECGDRSRARPHASYP